MIAEPWSLGAAHELLEPLEMLGIGGGHRAKVHRHAVLNHSVLLEDAIERGQRAAGIDHVIFRDDFKPVDDRLAGKDMGVVRNAQADANAVILKRIEAIAWHKCS